MQDPGKKHESDTQERVFFAAGDSLAERLQAEARDAGPDDEMVPSDREDRDARRRVLRRRLLILLAGTGALIAGVGVRATLQSTAAPGPEDRAASKPAPEAEPPAPAVREASMTGAPVLAPPSGAGEPSAPSTAAAPVLASGRRSAPAPGTEPSPRAAVERRSMPRPPAAPAPLATAGSGPRTRASHRAEGSTALPPARPRVAAPHTGAEWLSLARLYRTEKRASDAYRAYGQAVSRGNLVEAASGELGMAEMAYAMQQYASSVDHARRALELGAPATRSWRIMAEAYCRLGHGRAAWDAYTRAGGGMCK